MSEDAEAFNEMCTYVAARRWDSKLEGDRYVVADRASGESIEIEGRKDQDSYEWARFIAAVFNTFGEKNL